MRIVARCLHQMENGTMNKATQTDRQNAIAAIALLRAPITIQTNADFTPPGKRVARVVKTTRGQQLRFYVAGRLYRWLAVTPENLKMANEWIAARVA